MDFHGALNTMFVLRKFPHLFKGISRKGKKFSRIYVNANFPITMHLGKLGQEWVGEKFMVSMGIYVHYHFSLLR